MTLRSRSLCVRRVLGLLRLRFATFLATLLLTLAVLALTRRPFHDPRRRPSGGVLVGGNVWQWTLASMSASANNSNNRYFSRINSGNGNGKDRRFLTYLPHSGFHNQRIELENAIVLSILLNRTLVLPLARLGAKPLPYKPFDELLDVYSHSDKSWLAHCTATGVGAGVGAGTAGSGAKVGVGASADRVDIGWNSTVKECRKFDRFTHLSWQDVISIPAVEALGVDFVERWDFRQTFFQRQLGIEPGQVFSLKDTSAYDFQFCDRSSGYMAHKKYSRQVDLSEFSEVTEGYRLLQLGTLFGSSRLRLTMRENQLLYSRVRAAFKFSNRFLEDLTTEIVDEMGGVDNFYGVHLRVGDGLFSEQATENARIIWWSLLISGYSLEPEEVLELEESLLEDTSDIPEVPLTLAIKEPSHSHHPERAHTIFSCYKTNPANKFGQRFRVPLFIATDAPNIETHPALQYFTRVFSCVMTLSDFKHVTARLDGLINPLDGSPMAKFLLPFLDAMIISKSSLVYGTPESTFSRYIENVLWPLEHGRNIHS